MKKWPADGKIGFDNSWMKPRVNIQMKLETGQIKKVPCRAIGDYQRQEVRIRNQQSKKWRL